jgi:predicted PurR-regulated permease PerM
MRKRLVIDGASRRDPAIFLKGVVVMASEPAWVQLRNILIAIAVVVAMGVGAEFLQPLAVTLVLGFILSPLVDRLERIGLPRAVASVMSLVIMAVALGGIGYVVTRQVMDLAGELPRYEKTILTKLKVLRPDPESTLSKVTQVAKHVEESLDDKSSEMVPDATVRVIRDKGPLGDFQEALGPFQNAIGFGGIVLLLLLFLLMEREEIGDRIVQLAGRGQLSVTTRTIRQIAHRLSRYLATFALVNLSYGVVIGLGLWALGLPYAVLWGALAGLLRFIPYVGPAAAFAAPVVFSIAHFDTWGRPLAIIAFYGVAEIVSNSVEPFLYGKTTGVSAFGLLVAAVFWTWLWGPLGLLLSTPMTVCLVVLGRSVPGLGFLETLLRDDLEVADDLKFYQRLLVHEHDEADEFLTMALEGRSIEQVFDQVVMPALARSAHDHETGQLDIEELGKIHQFVDRWIDEQTASAELQPLAPVGATIVGVASTEASDRLALRMLEHLLAPFGVGLTMVLAGDSTLRVTEKVAELEPGLVLLSHTPPVGRSRARYLARRLQAHLKDVPLIVGVWDHECDPAVAAEPFRAFGAYKVVTDLASAREQVLARLRQKADEPNATPGPELVTAVASS